MKKNLRILGIVMAASLFGIASTVSAAEPATPPDNTGPGVVGSCPHGSGMGYGMMGGYGPGYGMGRGMMGGYGPGYGMGPGMMGGYGPGHGMGYGMMGWGNFQGLDLSKEQKAKVMQISHETRKKQWAIMGQMMDAQDKLLELYDADKPDSAAIKKQYKAIEDLRLQMMNNAVDAHSQINGILTKEQLKQLQEGGYPGYGSMMRGD